MPKTKTSKTGAIFAYIALLILLAAYGILCSYVYKDSLLAFSEPGRISGLNLHSGKYCSTAANWLQFRSHDPSEVKRLFKTAAVRSPADFDVFLSYFIYVSSQQCCKQQAGKLIRATVERNPSNVRLYLTAVNHFLNAGQKKEALLYFHKAVQMQPGNKTLRQLFAIAGDRITIEEIIGILPRTPETLSFLAQVLANKGAEAKEEWIRTIRELHSKEIEPSLNMKTAEQALKLGELELAKQFAEAALRHPETEANARKMLDKIERVASRQNKPKQRREN